MEKELLTFKDIGIDVVVQEENLKLELKRST
jgi:hypothetical protein